MLKFIYNFYKATINFSSDGTTNNRPTITITTTRNPNSPTLNYKQNNHSIQPIEVNLIFLKI
jgi:hypothetical protein